MNISKEIILKSDFNEEINRDVKHILNMFVAANPETDISHSAAILDKVLSSFGIEEYNISFESMANGGKVILKEETNES